MHMTARCTPTRGNVDDGAGLDELPEAQLLTLNGWRILMTHIVGVPPKGTRAGPHVAHGSID